jgi:hypothetical protein
MPDAALYDLTQEAVGAIYAAIHARRAPSDEQTHPPPLLQWHAGRAESAGWFLVQAAEFAPEPLTVARLRVRDVYGSPRLVSALLELMVSELWLDRAGEEYTWTEAGRVAYLRSRDRTRQLATTIQPLPEADLKELVALLERVIQASLASATPPGIWCLAHSRNRAPADDAPAVVKLFQCSSDFNAFRDDAHMAAWQPYKPGDGAWEAFALLCSGEASSAEALAQQLAHRGFSRHEYATILAEVNKRGWLEAAGDAGAYRVTEAGRTVRQDVERLTDAYFYAPWSCLSEGEVTRAQEQLAQILINLAGEGESG